MASFRSTSEQGEWGSPPLPPPIPIRNPRRVSPTLVDDERYQTTGREYRQIPEASSSAAQTIFGAIEREIDDTRKSLRSGLHASEDSGVRLGEDYDIRATAPDSMKRRPSETKRSSLLWSDDEDVSRTSTDSSLTQGLKRYSSILHQARVYSERRKEAKASRQRDIEDAASRLRHGRDALDAADTYSSYDGASQPGITAEEDARVERWLKLGSFVEPLLEADHVSQRSMSPTAAPEEDRPMPSVVPSLPTAFPLGHNGRDAYGNFIPTNTEDYLTSQSPPTSPPLRPIRKETHESKSVRTPSLRGGGGWWNVALGQSGKAPSVRKSIISAGRRRSTMRSRSSLVAHGPLPDDSRPTGKYSYAGSNFASSKGQSAGIATDQEWSDEESEASFDTNGHRQSKLLDHNRDNYHKDNRTRGPMASSTAVDAHTTVHNASKEPVDNGFPYPLRPGVSAGAKERLDARWASRQADLADADGATSLMSDLSYETRLEKRWNKAPSTAPPVQLPPPPPPKDLGLSSPTASYVKPRAKQQYAYEYDEGGASRSRRMDPNLYPPSAPPRDNAYCEDSWEIQSLQSLQLGESVSVMGDPRRNRVAPVSRPPAPQLTTEEYKAQQLTAQAEFRTYCQEIMARYNADLSRNQLELRQGLLTRNVFTITTEILHNNRIKALQHSARRCGYVILKDEASILEAMKTRNGYHIYHDMLHTTDPPAWQRLLEQYRAAANAAKPTRPPTPEKRRSESTSSFDRARHATGKLARFLLATPSDPELKTYSSRAKKEPNPNAFVPSIPPVWLNPMAVAAFTVPPDTRNRTAEPRNDKGKRREVPLISTRGIDQRDFAPAPAPSFLPAASFAPPSRSRVPALSAAGTNGQWTNTTVVPSPRAVHTDMRKYETGTPSPDPDPTAVTSVVSAWPESDSQGNWFDAKVARLRGGGAKEKREKKDKNKKEKKRDMTGWLSPLPEKEGVETSFAAYHAASLL